MPVRARSRILHVHGSDRSASVNAIFPGISAGMGVPPSQVTANFQRPYTCFHKGAGAHRLKVERTSNVERAPDDCNITEL